MAEWAFWGCLPFLAAAFITDIRQMRIPNYISVTALGSGLLVQGIMNGWHGLLFTVCGAGAAFVLLLILYMMGAVGAGDVKLFAGIGAWTGVFFTLQVLMYSILFGAVIGWVIVLCKREAGRRVQGIVSRTAGFLLLHNSGVWRAGSANEMLRFPFMLAVVPGFICAYYYL